MDIKKYEKVKALYEAAKEERAKAEGAREPLLQQLQTEFSISDPEQIEKALEKLTFQLEDKTEKTDALLKELCSLVGIE